MIIYYREFKNEIGYYGFGWSHNFQDVGIWSEGKSSTLFFKTEKISFEFAPLGISITISSLLYDSGFANSILR